jgi:hypothetical protein
MIAGGHQSLARPAVRSGMARCHDYLIPNRAMASSPDTCLPPGYSC